MIRAVAVITVSDTCFRDNSKDASGPALVEFVKTLFPSANLHTIIIPDEKEIIERELKYFCDVANVQLILTTGGTGLSCRDVTPEATKAVIHREIPAISVALTVDSLKKTPMAMLSRSVAGIRDSTLIINLPGSKKAVTECVEVIKPVLPHALSIILNEMTEIRSIHDSMQFGHVCPHHSASSNVDISKVALRPRESPYPMLEMSEAFNIVDNVMTQWAGGVETLSVGDALGKVVAESLYAKEPLPPFSASVKDGYACISSDGVGVRRVRTALAAGEQPHAPLAAGECARINTGAALPVGADCVVQVEDTKLISASGDNKTELEVEILVAPQPGQDVRPVGFDIPMSAVLVEKGSVLDAAQIGVLAGAGYQTISVHVTPKVALLSTGNELQEPGETVLKPAHIRDSNRAMLKALLKENGYDSIDCGIARDEPGELVAAIKSCLSKADILVCTGGVSMGERDLLKPVLVKDFGATIHFGRVRMKPGKPSTFATCQIDGETKFIFALPGNPVSAYVCCTVLALRALRACGGRAAPGWPRLRARMAHGRALDPRPEYARARLRLAAAPPPPPPPPHPAAPTGGGDLPVAHVLGDQCSSRLLSACGANVLLELPGATEAMKRLPAGAIVTALIIGRIDNIPS